MITPKAAARLFLERMLKDVYETTLKDIEARIIEGLPGQADDAAKIEKWHHNLNKYDQGLFLEIIQIVLQETIFSFLVTLDNEKGGPPIKGHESDFAIYIQSYSDLDSRVSNRPDEAVRFNSIKDEDLHDLFLDFVNSLR